jgi:hypothetical protein
MIQSRWSTLIAVVFFSLSAVASTGFHIGSAKTDNFAGIYAISTGWYYPVTGMISINPRGLEKTSPAYSAGHKGLTWRSTYGSVTQSMIAIGYPMSGINEKGLVIQGAIQMKPFADAGENDVVILTSHWLQYHLDTSATVAEVIQKSVMGSSVVVPNGKYPVQFQICDLKECAVFSFFKDDSSDKINFALAQGSAGVFGRNLTPGGRVITDHSNDGRTKISDWWRSAVSNVLYTDGIFALIQCQFAGDCDVYLKEKNRTTPLGRFVNAARSVEEFSGLNADQADLKKALSPEAVRERLFTNLQKFDQFAPLTTWNEAYELSSKDLTTHPFSVRFSYKRPAQEFSKLRWIEFNKPDFDCRKPQQLWVLDMVQEQGGDQTLTRVPQDQIAQVTHDVAYKHNNQDNPFKPGQPLFTEQELKQYLGYASTMKCSGQ